MPRRPKRCPTPRKRRKRNKAYRLKTVDRNQRSGQRLCCRMCYKKGGESRMGSKLVSLSAITFFALGLTFAGCSKKEETVVSPPPAPAPATPPVVVAPEGQPGAPGPAGPAGDPGQPGP